MSKKFEFSIENTLICPSSKFAALLTGMNLSPPLGVFAPLFGVGVFDRLGDLLFEGVFERLGDLFFEGVFEGVFFLSIDSFTLHFEGDFDTLVLVEDENDFCFDAFNDTFTLLLEFSSLFFCHLGIGPLVIGPSMFNKLFISFAYLNCAILAQMSVVNNLQC